MKKFIAVILTIVIVLSFSVTVFAGSSNTPDAKIAKFESYIGHNPQIISVANRATFEALKARAANWATLSKPDRVALRSEFAKLILDIKQIVIAKKAEIASFRLQIQALKSDFKANITTLDSIVAESKSCRTEIKAKLTTLKAQEGYQLPAAVSAKFAEIKILRETLEKTKSQIKDIIAANKANAANKNYLAIKAAFAQNIAIQQTRTSAIKSISTLIKDINSLLPAVPAAPTI